MSELREICHLWRRAAFGPTPHDLRRSLRQGYHATVHELVYYDDVADAVPPPPFTTVLPPGPLTLVEIAAVIQWWLDAMVRTRRQLQEKLVLYWHGHFTTSVDPVFSAGLLLRQNQTLRSFASGRFGDLLRAIATDAGMLIYLDGFTNRKDHPNENFARELLELFTLGIGHYTERDIREAARAFTGWSLALPDGHFVFHAEQHDDGPKRFLGQVGQFDGYDILRILENHEQTARFVCGRLYHFFADEAPSPDELGRLVHLYRRHHGHIRPLVEAILLSEGFRHAAYRDSGFKSPVEYVVSAIRAQGGEFTVWHMLEEMQRMGQLPLMPPSVKGWVSGPAWINASTLLDRMLMAHALAQETWPQLGAVELAGSGRDAARRLLGGLGMVDASATLRRVLASAWESTRSARCLLELALASPDFQKR